MKDKNSDEKNVKFISNEIELDILKYYNNDIAQDYFFISK